MEARGKIGGAGVGVQLLEEIRSCCSFFVRYSVEDTCSSSFADFVRPCCWQQEEVEMLAAGVEQGNWTLKEREQLLAVEFWRGVT